ncbi:hypothetical protein ACFQGW_18565 [Xanthomonas theicola]
MAPLHITPIRREDPKRSPGECVIAALVAARACLPPDADSRKEIETILRDTWLAGDLSHRSARNALQLACGIARECADFTRKIDRIRTSMQDGLYITRRNDNLYGRLFETHLAEYLVNNPDSSMLAVRDQVADYLLTDLHSYRTQTAGHLAKTIAAGLRIDPAPWRSDLPEFKAFLATPCKENLAKLLAYKGDKSVSLVLSLCVKHALAAPNFEKLKDKASAFYEAVILPQRNACDSSIQDPSSNLHGLLLPYQLGIHPALATTSGEGIRPIDRRKGPSPSTGLSHHDFAAIGAERIMGVGMSGSANILDHVFRNIMDSDHESDRNFPIQAAQIATAAWLSHSGGHSFNEAYSVFGYRRNKHFAPISFDQLELETYTAHQAIEHAFSHVLEAAERLLPSDAQS